MKFFEKDFLDFFAELEQNNDRDWFNENKKRYEKSVKKPFSVFVDHMIEKVRPFEPELNIQAKDAIFRIYRDTRFSKDKTPYKEHASALITSGGRKDYSTPGLYLEFSHKHARIYSGSYMLDKDPLYNLRTHIVNNMAEFDTLISDKDFVNEFGAVQGEKNKRLPKEFVGKAEEQPLLFNKGFYYYHTFPADAILADDFAESIIKRFELVQPLNDFLKEGVL